MANKELLEGFSKIVAQNTKEIIGNFEKRFEEIGQKMETIITEKEKLENIIETQRQRIESLEDKERKVNILIHGIEEEYYQTVLQKILEVIHKLDVNISRYCVKKITKIGGKRWNENGPILVTLTSEILKIDIMKNKFKLKTFADYSNIYIKEDISKKNRETRKELAPFSFNAMNQGKKVYMRNEKLVIDGKPWTLEELKSEQEKRDILEENENTTKKKSEHTGSSKRTFSNVSPENLGAKKDKIGHSNKKNKNNIQDNQQRNLLEMLGAATKSQGEVLDGNLTQGIAKEKERTQTM